jgi:hypothetical protein
MASLPARPREEVGMVRSFVSDASALPPQRSGRPKARATGGAEGRSVARSGADGSPASTLSGVCVGKAEAQSPAAKPHQEGVAETWVSAGMGGERPEGQRAGSNWGRVQPFPAQTQRVSGLSDSDPVFLDGGRISAALPKTTPSLWPSTSRMSADSAPSITTA